MKTSKLSFLLGLSCIGATLSHAAELYTAPSVPTSDSTQKMPGLVDGQDAFFTFGINFSSLTFTGAGGENSDHQILFESGGFLKGISLSLRDDGTLRFVSGGNSESAVTETSVDLTASGFSTGSDLRFVAAFHASATTPTLDLYLNETSKTASSTLANTDLAGGDGYGVATWSGDQPGALSVASNYPSPSSYNVTAIDFADGTMSDFVVYDNLTEALATVDTIPEPSSFALLAGFLGLTWIMTRRR